jgi:hypothetical protein
LSPPTTTRLHQQNIEEMRETGRLAMAIRTKQFATNRLNRHCHVDQPQQQFSQCEPMMKKMNYYFKGPPSFDPSTTAAI